MFNIFHVLTQLWNLVSNNIVFHLKILWKWQIHIFEMNSESQTDMTTFEEVNCFSESQTLFFGFFLVACDYWEHFEYLNSVPMHTNSK